MNESERNERVEIAPYPRHIDDPYSYVSPCLIDNPLSNLTCIALVDLKLIEVHPLLSGSALSRREIEFAAQSIIAVGLQFPILVRHQPFGRFQLITGELHWRAYMLLGREAIPAITRHLSNDVAAITVVSYEMQPRHTTEKVRGNAYAAMLRSGIANSHLDLGNKIGKSVSEIVRCLNR